MPTESQEQRAVVEWLEWRRVPFYHIPNGGRRDAVTGAVLKAQGARAGVPDLCIPVARKGYHGMYVEMKRRDGGAVTAEQRKWLATLEREGYLAIVCHGADEAMREIGAYLA